MARKSFVVRSTSDSGQAVGSWLRYEPGVGVDDDTKLRSDNLITAPVLSDIFNERYPSYSVGFFEGYIDTYNTVNLSWDAPLQTTLGVAPIPTKLILVYSTLGEPVTINDGIYLLETSTATKYTHVVPEGKWAYYSIFVKYEDNAGNVFYELGTTLSILVPKNYNSASDLFSKVPVYYRLQDGTMDTAGIGGPLERFISTFGFEVDRMRTTIDFLMTCKDPEIANSYILDVLSNDLSVGLLSEELGPYRLRSILNNIGNLRRTNGTEQGIKDFYTALTGSNVTVDSVNKKIKVYAQRVNLLKDPNIEYGLSNSLDAGAPGTAAFPILYDAGSPATASSPSGFTGTSADLLISTTGASVGTISGSGTASVPWVATVTGAASASLLTVGDGVVATNGTGSLFGGSPTTVEVTSKSSTSFTYKVVGGTIPTAGTVTNIRRVFSTMYDGGNAQGTGLVDINTNPPLWIMSPDTVTANTNVLQTSNADVYAIYGDTLYFSVQNEAVAQVQNLITKVALYSTAGYGNSGAVLVAEATTARISGGTRYWELVIPSSFTSYTGMFLCVFIPSVTPIESFKRMLLERSINAEYFDGTTVLGGWIRDAVGGSRSDYRWYNPSSPDAIGDQTASGLKNKNYSVYNSNYQKTRTIARRLLPSVIPVTELTTAATVYSNRPIDSADSRWSITFNHIPGVS